jgi:hypothetical protein
MLCPETAALTMQPLFELGKTPLEQPMRTIRTFFAPLIDKALHRRAQGGEGAHLIDRLVHVTDGSRRPRDGLARDTDKQITS